MLRQRRLGEAMRLLMDGAFLRACAASEAILELWPGDQHAELLRGLATASMGEADRAAPMLLAVAAACPAAVHPCTEFARLTPQPPRKVVERQFRSCLVLAPDDAKLRTAFASFLLDGDQGADAETVLQGLAETGEVWHLRGLVYAEQGRFSEAKYAFQVATTLMPNAAPSWSNYATMLKVEGCFPEAVAAHDRAVTLAPHDPTLRVNRAVTHLRAGTWDRAWPDYEARLDVPGAPSLDKSRLLPDLQPMDDLTGVTIIALHEDGFGDTIHFCRYLPLLAARGARVVALVPPPLVRLIQGVQGVAEVISDATQVPPYHYICPMFSFPGVFRSTPETVPPAPCVTLDAELVQRWQYRLPRGRALKAGLAWAGQARPDAPGFAALDRRRSAGLAALGPLFDVPDIWFVSLQKGKPADERRPPTLTLFDPMTLVEDFADTAAIIANLDVVVSVDTSVVHLAGLMGKPVLLLDRYDTCWRWLHGRTDSPWYPNLTIFRQDRPNDWASAMVRAATALRHMSENAKSRRTQVA